MSTKLCKNGVSQSRVTDKMWAFAIEYSIDLDKRAAAVRAGYSEKTASAMGCKLLKHPLVAKIVGKLLREKQERSELKADNVVEYIRFVLFMNPLKYFRPYKRGKWEVLDPDGLPDSVGQLIETMETQVEVDKDGVETSRLFVTIVNKTVVLGLAMKHLGMFPDKVGEVLQKMALDYDQIYLRKENGEPLDVPSEPVDLIEQRLVQEENDG